MAGIQTIKNHYKNNLSIKSIRDFLAKSRAYTIHYQFKPVIHNPYYIRRLRQMIQVDLTDVSKISEFNDGFRFILVAIDCFRNGSQIMLIGRSFLSRISCQRRQYLSFPDSLPQTGVFRRRHCYVWRWNKLIQLPKLFRWAILGRQNATY